MFNESIFFLFFHVFLFLNFFLYFLIFFTFFSIFHIFSYFPLFFVLFLFFHIFPSVLPLTRKNLVTQTRLVSYGIQLYSFLQGRNSFVCKKHIRFIISYSESWRRETDNIVLTWIVNDGSSLTKNCFLELFVSTGRYSAFERRFHTSIQQFFFFNATSPPLLRVTATKGLDSITASGALWGLALFSAQFRFTQYSRTVE